MKVLIESKGWTGIQVASIISDGQSSGFSCGAAVMVDERLDFSELVSELRLRSLHKLWTSEHQDIIRGEEL